jgi:PAS domain S-box-containing protein
MNYPELSREELFQELDKLRKENDQLKKTYQEEITERKRAEKALLQSNEKLEAIISATPDGIGMISMDGKIQLIMSNKLPEMYGYSIEEQDKFVGRSAFDFIDPSNHKTLIDNIQKLVAGKNDDSLTEYVALKKDNTRFYIDVNSTVMRDSEGNPTGILFVERDITRRKQAEAEIVQKNLELAELNATKDKFFSIIAHDLRSPFQGLLGAAKILSSQYQTLSEEERLSFIQSIETLSRNSFKLLDNLLEWARIQTGQLILQLEEFNLLAGLNPTLTLIEQSAFNKGIKFNYTIDNSIFITADKNMLTTIIRNIAFNAVKFTKSGGIVNLIVNKSEQFIQFTIMDTGIGIEEKNLDKLFKIDGKVRRKGTADETGTGLGLLLSKEMIEKHGGEIKVESKTGEGTTFSFTLVQHH